MTDVRQQPGIPERIWIAGQSYTRDPLPTITRQRMEKKTLTANGTLRIDRQFVADGLPNVLEMFSLALTWSELREAGLLEHVDRLQAVGQPFDIGLWKHFYCVYDGDGSAKTFLLPRRQLVKLVTPRVPFADLPTRVTTFDKPLTDPTATPTELTVVDKTSATIISDGDPSSGEVWIETDGHASGSAIYCTMRLGDAPAAYHDTLCVSYVPAFRVVVDAEDPRAYQAALNEPRAIKFLDVG